MTAIEHIKAAQSSGSDNERGEAAAIKLSPPLSPERIEALEAQVGQPLPMELRMVLAFCTEIHGCPLEVDFSGSRMAFEQKEVFLHGLPIAHDGCGNFWVLDLTPDTSVAAPIFHACHDPPVILYQSADMASFVEALFLTMSRERSIIDNVLGGALSYVWDKNPGVIDRGTASQSSDASVRSFASGLPEHFQIVDLRKAKPGMGFSWGRHGPRTEIRRHGYEHIFAYAKPQRTASSKSFSADES